MKKDTKTFLITMLGIPAVLFSAWGVHSMDAASTVMVTREPEIVFETPPQEEVSQEPQKPVVRVVSQAPVATVSTPIPVVTPTPPPIATSLPAVPAKKQKASRRTRAS